MTCRQHADSRDWSQKRLILRAESRGRKQEAGGYTQDLKAESCSEIVSFRTGQLLKALWILGELCCRGNDTVTAALAAV